MRALIRGAGTAGGGDPVADLIREHRAIHPHADGDVLRRAYDIAEQAHRGQYRKSGEPYITHPLAVARILAALGMDTTTLVAALLHDTVEDTSYTLAALCKDFGPDVATVVDGVTKVERVSYGDDAEAETIRKMILAAGRDVRVLVVKLADRLHNMQTLDVRSPASRQRVARATRDVLIPLADRLGIQALKRELADLVLRHLEPEAYARIEDHLQNRPQWAEYLEAVCAAARAALKRHQVTAEVAPRPRHHSSIWKDTLAGGHRDPFDLPRIVIIVHGPDTDCYAALGAMHATWRPVPGRFKDFIASPKNNLYRSLHTTVIGPDHRSVEILIRTEAMHRDAEYGIAAGFRFGQRGQRPDGDQLPWLRRVLEWERRAKDPAQFLDALHRDLVEGEIHVFTPSGRRVQLPAESTPVDLAYELDTHLGDQCVAALVNGRLVPLSAPLSDGDVVDILTRHDELPTDVPQPDDAAGTDPGTDVDDEPGDDPPGPSRDWLAFVKTPQARLEISRWFEGYDQASPASPAQKVRLGLAAVGLALRRRDRRLATEVPLRRLAGLLGYRDPEALLVAVADHLLSAEQVVEKLIALVDHGPLAAGAPPPATP
ncbi:MAG: HD domain-containing protein [Micromonosporaceae bacterium]